MTRLERHAFGEGASTAAFGHSGHVGTSFAFADPERSLAVGVVFNGIVDYEVAFIRRRGLLRALFTDLDDQAATTDEPAAEPRRKRRFRR